MRKFCRQFATCIAWLALEAAAAIAQSNLPEPVMWRQDTFLIPYQFNGASDSKAAREVVLYVSKDWGRTWREVTRARPDVRFFTYRAEGDGDYCFAMRTIDQTGQSWPAGEPATELRVVVDTHPPQFQALQGAIDSQGNVQLVWRATDEHLDPTSLKIEIQAEGQTVWQLVETGAGPSISRTEIAGQATATAPFGVQRVLVRATIFDKAGNRATSGAEATSNATLPPLPQSTPAAPVSHGGWQAAPPTSRIAPAIQDQVVNPFTGYSSTPSVPPAQPSMQNMSASAPPSQHWPADAHSLAPFSSSIANPPPRVAGIDGLRPVPAEPSPPAPTPWSNSPFHQVSSSRSSEFESQPPAPTIAAVTPMPPDARAVNTPYFALDYDVSDVGRWGVAKVELWGTADGGQTWRSFAIDHDNRSPVNVTAPGEGLYGFRIAIEAVGGLAPQAPTPGEKPELWVHVDTTQPQAQLLSARQGEGYFADHLEITWQAGDANLADRPIGLYYSSRSTGPWTAAATNLDNTGRYSWRLQRHVPSQIYLRIEARDRAGNVGIHQMPQPLSLSVPQATGSLRDLHRP